MENGLEKELFVGFDDSNHAGDRKGYIIVATFSFDKKDSNIQKFPNRKDSNYLKEWFGTPFSGYHFAVLLDEELRKMQPNIPLVASYLINSFLNEYSSKIDNLKIFLDGILPSLFKSYLKSEFQCEFSNVVIDHFIKKLNVHNCPKVVYMADIFSSEIYHEISFNKVINHQKRVELKESKLLDILHSIKGV